MFLLKEESYYRSKGGCREGCVVSYLLHIQKKKRIGKARRFVVGGEQPTTRGVRSYFFLHAQIIKETTIRRKQ